MHSTPGEHFGNEDQRSRATQPPPAALSAKSVVVSTPTPVLECALAGGGARSLTARNITDEQLDLQKLW